MLFIYLLLAVLGLCCCIWIFSSCREWGQLLSCSVWASHCHGFSRSRAWAQGRAGFSSWRHGLRCPAACGMSPALAGGFLTTGPPEKSTFNSLIHTIDQSLFLTPCLFSFQLFQPQLLFPLFIWILLLSLHFLSLCLFTWFYTLDYILELPLCLLYLLNICMWIFTFISVYSKLNLPSSLLYFFHPPVPPALINRISLNSHLDLEASLESL